MQLTINQRKLNTLAQYIGTRLITITTDDDRKFNRAYGNISLELDKENLLITNDYIDMSNVANHVMLEEEIIYDLDFNNRTNNVFENDEVYTQEINSMITNIILIRDSISIYDKDGKSLDYVIVDEGLIFVLETKELLVSRLSDMTPMNTVIIDNNVITKLRTIEEVEKEWTDQESDDYHAKVTREIISLLKH